MRRSLLAATAIIGLVFAPSVWAQQGGTGGASPGTGGVGTSGGGMKGGGAGDEMKGERGDMRSQGGDKAGDMRQQGDQKTRQGADEMRGDKAKGAERDHEKGKGADYERGDKAKGAERDQDDKAKGAESERGDKTKGAERERGEHSGGAASLSTEQKTKVRTGFRGASIKEARDINITNVAVGTSAPRTVVDYWEPVPATIVEVVPEWRAYKVVRIRGDIVVIDPDTFEIVYVM